MKKLLYIGVLLIIVSCARNDSAKHNEMMIVSAEKETEVIISKEEALEFLALQRLQDELEVLKLKQANPAFDLKERIFEQKGFSHKLTIKNLHLLSEKRMLDTVFLKFELITTDQKQTKKDTINAKITTEKVVVDGKTIETQRFEFLK